MAEEGRQEQCLKKDLNEQLKCHIQILLPLSSAGGGCINVQLLNVQQVSEAEFTPGTRHTPPPIPPSSPPCDWQRWCEKLQVSLMCLFWSISVTGRPGLPFVHRRGEAGRAGPDQIQPSWSGSDPAPFGLITHLYQSHHPGLHHWGRSHPPQEAAVDKEYKIKTNC